VVSNGAANSISVISAVDHQVKQNVAVGPTPGAVMVYAVGSAAAGNQATASVTSGTGQTPTLLPERFDDYGMKE
jgi:hypothetical protein